MAMAVRRWTGLLIALAAGWYAAGAVPAAAAPTGQAVALYTCPHRSYAGTATIYGAEFLAENAFRPVGGDG
jgi:hypothetical protein